MSPETWIRPDLRELKAYSSARDEFEGTAGTWLDANEHPSATPWNRYPDPMQSQLKDRIAQLKNCSAEELLLGNGSDEVLDLIFRLVGQPFADTVAFFDPSYGMYEVLAKLNGLKCQRIPLDEAFESRAEVILPQLEQVKLLVVCRPNNPTGNLLDREELIRILRTFSGVVVIDEAYIDFCPQESFAGLVSVFPNLIVVQTLSKAFGMAGLRIGMALADPRWIRLLNGIKPPYNIGSLVQETALQLLETTGWEGQVNELLKERARVFVFLEAHPLVEKVFSSETNFLLFRVGDAARLYDHLVANGIVVRNRSSQFRCENTLRVTIGTPAENDRFMQIIHAY